MAKLYFEQLSDIVKQVDLELGNSLDVKLEIKHFFNGAAVYANGKICISLSPAGMALKLPENERKKLFQARKAKSLRYFPKAPIKKDYAVLSEALVENMDTLSYWMKLSIEYVTKFSLLKKAK